MLHDQRSFSHKDYYIVSHINIAAVRNDVKTKCVYCHVVSEHILLNHNRIYCTRNIRKMFIIENIKVMILIFI